MTTPTMFLHGFSPRVPVQLCRIGRSPESPESPESRGVRHRSGHAEDQHLVPSLFWHPREKVGGYPSSRPVFCHIGHREEVQRCA
jgi:hypothetical protein